MRYLLVAILFLSTVHFCNAHRPQATYGAPFEEVHGFHKILELSNGNTILFQVDLPFMIEVRMYDNNHKEISHKKFSQGSSVTTGPVDLAGIYEIAGKPVMFMSKSRNGGYLKRLIFNENTGMIESKEMIVSPVTTSAARKSAITYIVEKDIKSDRYSVYRQNYSGVTYFDFYDVEDGKHQLVKTVEDTTGVSYMAGCYLPDNKYFVASDMPTEQESYISVIDIATGETKRNTIDFGEGEYSYRNSIVKYNELRGIVQLLTTVNVEKEEKRNKTVTYFGSYMKYIDYKSLQPISTSVIINEKVQSFIDKNFELKKPQRFIAKPQDFIMNADNTTTIISEESNEKITTITNGGRVSYGSNTIYETNFDIVGVTIINDKGAELDGYAIYKKQLATQEFDSYYLLSQKKGAPFIGRGIESLGQYLKFFSVDYLITNTGIHIIYNDAQENFDAPERKFARVSGASTASVILHKYSNGKIEKINMYAEPTKKANTFGLIGAHHYSREKNTYTTVVMQREGRKKVARVVWVKLD